MQNFSKIRDTEAANHACEACGRRAGYTLGKQPLHHVCQEDYIVFRVFQATYIREATWEGPYGSGWWEVLYTKWFGGIRRES